MNNVNAEPICFKICSCACVGEKQKGGRGGDCWRSSDPQNGGSHVRKLELTGISRAKHFYSCSFTSRKIRMSRDAWHLSSGPAFFCETAPDDPVPSKQAARKRNSFGFGTSSPGPLFPGSDPFCNSDNLGRLTGRIPPCLKVSRD